MTAQGSARTRFRRALASGDPLLAKAALAELPRVGVADALAVVLLYRAHEEFQHVAVRFHAKLCREVRLTMPEAQLALCALQSLEGDGAAAGVNALLALFERHGLADAAEVMDAWPRV